MPKRSSKYIVIPVQFWLNSTLSWNEKIVLIELESVSGDSGYAKPIGRISESLGIPKHVVKETVSMLEKKGAVTVTMDESGNQTIVPHIGKREYDTLTAQPTELADKEPEKIDYDFILSEWTRLNPDLPHPRKMTPKLQSKIRGLLKNNATSVDELIKIFRAVATSEFLNGKNDRNWKARFDWVVSDTGGCYQKIMMGVYHRNQNERINLDEIFAEDTETDNTDNYYR